MSWKYYTRQYYNNLDSSEKKHQRLFCSISIQKMFYLHDRSRFLNSLSANPIKWSKTLKQLVGNLPTICLSVFDHFVGLALKELIVCFPKIFRWSVQLRTPRNFIRHDRFTSQSLFFKTGKRKC